MGVTNALNTANAKLRAFHRLRVDDPTTYTVPKKKRIDGKFTLIGALANELGAIIDSESVGKRVRIKNTTGSTIAAGAMLYLATAKLSAQTTATAVNNPLAGTSVVISVAATFEVGQVVSVASLGYTDYAIVTAVSAGASATVDILNYDHTLPVVTALPAYEVSLADADGAVPAEWTVTASVATSAYAWAWDCAEVSGIDTSAFTAEALLYLSGTAGAYTATAPTGADQIQQVVGVVITSNAVTGKVWCFPGNKRIVKMGTSMLQALGITNALIAANTIDLPTKSVAGAAGTALHGGVSANSFRYSGQILTKSATYQILAADHGSLINCSTSFTITLPPVSGLAGWYCTIRKTDSSATAVTVDGSGSETINGALNNVLTSQYSFVTLFCNGSSWDVIACNDYLVARNASSTAVDTMPATANWGDGCSITLQPGEWDLCAILDAQWVATYAGSSVDVGISTTTGNSATGLVLGDNWAESFPPTVSCNFTGSVSGYRVVVTAATTYYLKIKSIFTGASPSYRCRLSARRVA